MCPGGLWTGARASWLHVRPWASPVLPLLVLVYPHQAGDWAPWAWGPVDSDPVGILRRPGKRTSDPSRKAAWKSLHERR